MFHECTTETKCVMKLNMPYWKVTFLRISLTLRPANPLWSPKLQTPNQLLLTVICRHLFTFMCQRFSSTYNKALNLFLPILFFSSVFIYLNILPCYIFTKCLIHSILFFFMSATVSKTFYSFYHAWLIFIQYIPCCITCLYTLFNIFFSFVFIVSFVVRNHVFLSHKTSFAIV